MTTDAKALAGWYQNRGHRSPAPIPRRASAERLRAGQPCRGHRAHARRRKRTREFAPDSKPLHHTVGKLRGAIRQPLPLGVGPLGATPRESTNRAGRDELRRRLPSGRALGRPGRSRGRRIRATAHTRWSRPTPAPRASTGRALRRCAAARHTRARAPSAPAPTPVARTSSSGRLSSSESMCRL